MTRSYISCLVGFGFLIWIPLVFMTCMHVSSLRFHRINGIRECVISNNILTTNKVHKPNSNGKWTNGRKYKDTCNLQHKHGCCEAESNRFYYKFFNFELNNIDGVKSLHQKLRGKNLTILGDSLQRLFFLGITEILDLPRPSISVVFKAKDQKISASLTKVKHKSNGWIHYLYFYYYMDLGAECKVSQDKRFVVNRTIVQSVVNMSDIIIANLGLHYHFCSVKSYSESVRQFSELLYTEKLNSNRKEIILRATLPQHFTSLGDTGFFESYNANASCAKKASTTENPTNAILKQAAYFYGFKYLNNYNIYRERYDMHSISHKGDCTHYCYSPELIAPEIILIDQLLN